MKARVRQHVHLAIQELFEVLTKGHQIEERAVWVHLYEQFDVTRGMVLAACDGAEQTYVVSTVARRDLENLLAFVLQNEWPCRRSW